MKTRILSMAIVIGLSTITMFAQSEKTEKFEVAGNCGMCETRIEKAANSVDGVLSADWDKVTKMIDVKFIKQMTKYTKNYPVAASMKG